MAMMNNSNNTPYYNPWKASPKDKNFLSNQTMSQCIVGSYSSFPKFEHKLYGFTKSFEPPNPMGICEVNIINEHILDVVEKYSEKGINYFNNDSNSTNNFNPITVNVVGQNFSGSNLGNNEELRDELINIRTTYSNTFSDTKIFPLKKDECSYLKIVSIIRSSFPIINSFLPFHETFRTAMITSSPIQVDPETYVSGENYIDGKMCANDFVDTLTKIEAIFQFSIYKQHPILILPPFGHNDIDNNPIDDIIKIYNYCIYKYGHVFKKIIIAIPKFYPKEILLRYQKKIINPFELVKDVDRKYQIVKIDNKSNFQNNQINNNLTIDPNIQNLVKTLSPDQLLMIKQLII
jgi:hypothetical protein